MPGMLLTMRLLLLVDLTLSWLQPRTWFTISIRNDMPPIPDSGTLWFCPETRLV